MTRYVEVSVCHNIARLLEKEKKKHRIFEWNTKVLEPFSLMQRGAQNPYFCSQKLQHVGANFLVFALTLHSTHLGA